MDDVELIAVCRRTYKRPAGISEQCQLYTDYRAMIHNERLDGVIAAVSPFEHPSIVQVALDTGIPVLVEKPLVLKTGLLDFLHNYPQSLILINYIHLYASGFMAMTKAIKGQRIIGIRTEHTGSAKDRGFSSLFDYGTHDIAICMELTGVSVPVCRSVKKEVIAEGREIFDIEMEFGDVPVQMRVGNGGTHKIKRFEVLTEKGRYIYDGNDPALYQSNGIAYGFIGPLAGKPLNTVIKTFISGKFDTQKIIKQTRHITNTIQECLLSV